MLRESALILFKVVGKSFERTAFQSPPLRGLGCIGRDGGDRDVSFLETRGNDGAVVLPPPLHLRRPLGDVEVRVPVRGHWFVREETKGWWIGCQLKQSVKNHCQGKDGLS